MTQNIPTGRYFRNDVGVGLPAAFTRLRHDLLVRRRPVCKYLEPQLNGSVMAFVQPRRSEQLFRWRESALLSEVTHD